MGTYNIHKAVDEAFRCRGENSCYEGADDMSKCTCLNDMRKALPGKCEVIDSVRAKKALECVEALIRFSEEKSQYYDLSHDEIDRILEKHGFQIGKKA